MLLAFTKMNGAGNDFVLVDNRSHAIKLERDQIVRLCHRQRGVGADGLILLVPCASGKAGTERPKPIKHQSAPVTSESAPTITCNVTTSAALFVIVVRLAPASGRETESMRKLAPWSQSEWRLAGE